MIENKVIYEEPIVKILPFIERPQRYIKCKVKEADAMMIYEVNDPKSTSSNGKRALNKPVRIVMNNFTLSVFENSNYFSNLLTFDMDRSTLKISPDRHYCVIVIQSEKEIEFCPFNLNKTDTAFVEEWNYDFELFKNQCHEKRASDPIIEKLGEYYRKKVREAEIDIDMEKNELIKKKLQNEENQQIAEKIIKTADITLQAIEKEHSLEQMIKEEEEHRQENKLREIESMIEHEEEKKKELSREYNQKELESETLLQTQEHELEFKKTQQEATQKVLLARNKLKNTLVQMRKKFKTKESTLKSKLFRVRNEVASEVSNSFKNGDMERCKEAVGDLELRQAYCKINFKDNPFNYMKCKDDSDFCSICCENEFGEMIIEKRKICLTTLCTKI